jgi:hypothetical protein
VEKRSRDFPAQAVKGRPDEDKSIPDGIIINLGIRSFLTAFPGDFGFQVCIDEFPGTLIGREADSVLSFIAGWLTKMPRILDFTGFFAF